MQRRQKKGDVDESHGLRHQAARHYHHGVQLRATTGASYVARNFIPWGGLSKPRLKGFHPKHPQSLCHSGRGFICRHSSSTRPPAPSTPSPKPEPRGQRVSVSVFRTCWLRKATTEKTSLRSAKVSMSLDIFVRLKLHNRP